MILVDLSDDDLAQRRPRLIREYAEAVAADFAMPLADAIADAERSMVEMLPKGVHTEGHLLRKAVDDGAEVGFLWISLPGTLFPTMAWITEIEVAEAHRSKGYGSAMILAAEADLVERGVHRIGLHVFGHNPGARRLYERLGYRVMAQARARTIKTTEAAPLQPMTQTAYEDHVAALLRDDPIALARDPEAAPEKAQQIVDQIAPHGLKTEGVYFWTAPGGWIWFSLPHPTRSPMGMIHYVAVDPAHRRRGVAQSLIAAAEAEMARHGETRSSLNVVASNHAALALADRLGYQLASQQMIKDL